MLIETILLAILIGLIMKGKIRNLATFQLRAMYLILIALLIRFSGRIVELKALSAYASTITLIVPWLFTASYMLILIVAALNLNYRGMIAVLVGTIMNILVVITNGGYMPVSRSQLLRGGFPIQEITDGRLDINHVLSDASTKLVFLGDIILIPPPYPFPSMLSIGDLFLCIGILLIVVLQMTKKQDDSITDQNRVRHINIDFTK